MDINILKVTSKLASLCVLSVSLLGIAEANVNSSTQTPRVHSSHYTSLKDDDCQRFGDLDDYGLYQANCPSKGGYQLQVVGSDLRFGANLVYGEHEVFHQPIAPFMVGDTAEWRFEQTNNNIRYHTLIYRINIAQVDNLDNGFAFLPREQDKQNLIVIRLNKNKSCIIGIIEQGTNMNKKARKIADDANSTCI